ncbi:MAG: type 4a pilus biogenesis protein PilO [Deltaproteobacteria bacterium]|nr:type 4a pilus biogenesis protein PilO [Deltaproteobacteria bacterium]
MNGDMLKSLQSINLPFLKKFKREFIAALALIAFSFISYKLVYLRNISEIARTEARINGARSDIEKIEAETRAAGNLSKTAAEAAANLKLLEERLRSLKERLPSDKQVSRLLSEFSENDTGRGIRIVSIKPLPPEEKGALSRLPFQITMEARFIPFGDYLERVEKMPRLIIVDNFMIEPKEENSATLRTQVYLSAYIMNYGH